MKQIFILSVLLLAIGYVSAQSIEEGNKQLYYERYLSAQNTFENILKQQPDNAEAVYGLTKVYFIQEDASKAMELLQQKTASMSHEPYFQVAYGYLLVQQGKKDSAQIYFANAVAKTKEKDAGILAAVAEANIAGKNGNAAYAVDLLNKAIDRDKKNAAYQALLGDAYRRSTQGDGSQAYQAYQRALNLDPNYAAAYYRLGTIFLTQKNYSYFVHNLDQATTVDPNYAPAYYSLYTYYFSRDPKMAMDYFTKYNEHADQDWRTEYAKMDLLYLNKQYTDAINAAETILKRDGEKAKPRLYKLMAYSYEEQKDSAKALTNMQTYFAKELDSNFITKDFEAISDLFAAKGNLDSASAYLERGIQAEKDSADFFALYKKIAGIYKAKQDYSNEARYMGKYYVNNPKATNVDLFNWGLEHYRAKEYQLADSVFGMYVAAYPQQGFGYYWQARSKALLDKDMQEGLAVPVYQKLIEVIGDHTAEANNKKWVIEAYNYLAAYQTNTQKNYNEAIGYFEKILTIDPANVDATKYIDVLKKSMAKQEKDGNSK